MAFFRRRPPEADVPNEPSRFRARFGGDTCPVCGGPLGGQAPMADDRRSYLLPPPLRLELGMRRGTKYPFRITALDGHDQIDDVSDDPPFIPQTTDFVYVLCSNGHIFPDSAPGRQTADHDTDHYKISHWRMAAVIGPTGSGKTYLAIRMLSQSLVNPDETTDPTRQRVTLCSLTPLERVPWQIRRAGYREMLQNGNALGPTQINLDGTPLDILTTEVPDAVPRIQAIVDETVEFGDMFADDWGKLTRQPLVLRTMYGGKRTWIGLADLPGELFNEQNRDRTEGVRLNQYDALIWVLDPVLADNATDWLVASEFGGVDPERLMFGSLRPEVLDAGVTSWVVRNRRNEVQGDIGHELGIADGRYQTHGGTISTFVAINKSDLIHAALRHRRLTDFGAGRSVLDGTLAYLNYAAERKKNDLAHAHPDAAQLLDYIRPDSGREAIRTERTEAVARALLAHYSRPEEFWWLAKEGNDRTRDRTPDDYRTYDQVTVSVAGANVGFQFRVPTLGAHMSAWSGSGYDSYILLRDLVMSAIGCGLAYGLGYANQVYTLLGLENHDTRFFLCSALTKVPVAADGLKLRPHDAHDRFPPVDERSAALTQLMLATIGKAVTE